MNPTIRSPPGIEPRDNLSHVRGPTDSAAVDRHHRRAAGRHRCRASPIGPPSFSASRTCAGPGREFKAEVDRALPRASRRSACKRGDRLGIWSPNRVEWLVTQFATARIGVILVNINPAYRLHELEYALNASGCRAIVSAERLRTSQYLEMLQALAPELASANPASWLRGASRASARDPDGRRRIRPACSATTRWCPAALRYWIRHRSTASPLRSTATIRSTSSSPAARPATPRARR